MNTEVRKEVGMTRQQPLKRACSGEHIRVRKNGMWVYYQFIVMDGFCYRKPCACTIPEYAK